MRIKELGWITKEKLVELMLKPRKKYYGIDEYDYKRTLDVATIPGGIKLFVLQGTPIRGLAVWHEVSRLLFIYECDGSGKLFSKYWIEDGKCLE